MEGPAKTSGIITSVLVNLSILGRDVNTVGKNTFFILHVIKLRKVNIS